jgi:DIM1 family U5 snRNP protein
MQLPTRAHLPTSPLYLPTHSPPRPKVDISEVPDFNTMYELYDPCTVMFFFRNKHIMVDLGTGAARGTRGPCSRGRAGRAGVRRGLILARSQPRPCHAAHPAPLTPHPQGNNNKINWAMNDKQEFIDIVETVYRGARKGRGLVVSPKDYSTKYRY